MVKAIQQPPLVKKNYILAKRNSGNITDFARVFRQLFIPKPYGMILDEDHNPDIDSIDGVAFSKMDDSQCYAQIPSTNTSEIHDCDNSEKTGVRRLIKGQRTLVYTF